MNAIKHSAPARASQPPITRRQAFRALGQGAAAGAAAALPIAATAAVDPSPDAELLRLGAELEAAWTRENLLIVDNDSMETDAAFQALLDATGNVARQIEALSARTLEGLAVKARAISWTHGGEVIGPYSLNEQATTDCRIAASIVRDLLQLIAPA